MPPSPLHKALEDWRAAERRVHELDEAEAPQDVIAAAEEAVSAARDAYHRLAAEVERREPTASSISVDPAAGSRSARNL